MRHALLTLLIVAVPRVALACPVCFGQSDAPLAKAINYGVIAMLVVVACVLAGFAAFIVYLNRRGRLAADMQSRSVRSNGQEGTAQC